MKTVDSQTSAGIDPAGIAPIIRLMLCMLPLWMPIPAAAGAPELITNVIGMPFVTIPAGSFRMGTTEPDRLLAIDEMPKPDLKAFRDEQVAHVVGISHWFLLGQTEVTQAQWLRVMENRPGPSDLWQRDDWRELPVVSVSWFMAQRFADELSAIDPDYNYRLPTEAEWEYAARAGSEGLRPVAVLDLSDHAWFIEASDDQPHPVAGLLPNAFGLHDMLGNAWEWVADWYALDGYGDGAARHDPQGPERGRGRVRRGGSYHCPLFQTRPGYRAVDTPDTRYSVIGFRVIAMPIASPTSAGPE